MEIAGKIGLIAVAIISGIAVFVAFTALGPAKVNYAGNDLTRRQQTLDNIARGFELGYKATAGGQSEITRVTTDAERDLVAVDIRFINKNVEYAGYQQIEGFRKDAYSQVCGFLDKKGVTGQGISLVLRMKKPSGSPLTTLTFNDEGCAPFLKSA